MRPVVYALHGFLGLTSDWLAVPSVHEVRAVDLYDRQLPKPQAGMAVWAKHFNEHVAAQIKPDEKPILLGYSLGGRLALHVLADNPTLWAGGIICSAHPGLKTPAECEGRRSHDASWAEKFRHEEWSQVMKAWNAQDVFKGTSFQLERHEADQSRTNLSETLLHWSLGRQKDFRTELGTWPLPILWLVGAADAKAISNTQNLSFSHPLSRIDIIPQAGHRFPWEQPRLSQECIEPFIEKILVAVNIF